MQLYSCYPCQQMYRRAAEFLVCSSSSTICRTLLFLATGTPLPCASKVPFRFFRMSTPQTLTSAFPFAVMQEELEIIDECHALR
jgi:hypothetical protein